MVLAQMRYQAVTSPVLKSYWPRVLHIVAAETALYKLPLLHLQLVR